MSVVARSAEQMEDQPLLPQLIQRHGALLLRLAQRQVGPEAAQELTQQTLAWLAERQKDWAQLEEAPLAAYLAAAVQRQSAALRRQVQEEQSWRTQPTEELACPGPSLEEQAILGQQKQALAKIWPRLPEEDRLALEAKYILQLGDRQIARQLGIKPASVRMRLTRARRLARKEMEKEGWGE